MNMTLHLSAELERRLATVAAQRSLTLEECAVRVLDAHLPHSLGPPLSADERRKKLVEAIESWINDDDPEEQRETGEYLIRVLDEDRLSDRKLFPPELKGITW